MQPVYASLFVIGLSSSLSLSRRGCIRVITDSDASESSPTRMHPSQHRLGCVRNTPDSDASESSTTRMRPSHHRLGYIRVITDSDTSESSTTRMRPSHHRLGCVRVRGSMRVQAAAAAAAAAAGGGGGGVRIRRVSPCTERTNLPLPSRSASSSGFCMPSLFFPILFCI